jgi:HK97 family phage prohead protease
MDDKLETRRVKFADFEVRATTEDDSDYMSFRGYAAVFDSPSQPLPFVETVRKGAFKKSLRSRNNVRMYLNHDSNMLLATTRAGTLRLEEDDKGLLVDADLPPTTVGRDLSILMQRGDVDSMSFGFSVPRGGDIYSEDGSTRELKEVRLFEVSVVTGFPAYEATTASVRSLDALAQRAEVDADKLAAAITVLEAGSELDEEQAALLSDVVAKLRKQPDGNPERINVMQKQLEMLKDIA